MNTINSVSRISESIPKQRIIVSVEGEKTEYAYFNALNSIQDDFWIEIAPHIDSAPKHVFSALKQYVNSETIRTDDEFWVVLDRDKHHEDQYLQIIDWCTNNSAFNMAVSNPCFELWLLLHHDLDENQLSEFDSLIDKPSEYKKRYNIELGSLFKRVKFMNLEWSIIVRAVSRAKKIDKTAENGWPVKAGNTTVYRIFEQFV